MESKSQKGQEGVLEIEGVPEGEEGVQEGEEGFPEGEQNFEEEFCTAFWKNMLWN